MMKNIAEVNDAVAVKKFMFESTGGRLQRFVNCDILKDLTYNGKAIVVMTKDWEDYETGWRYHAAPVNKELVEFLKSHEAKKPLKVYVSEFDIDWTPITESDKMELINLDPQWHSWKCRCGGLNGRSNGNCGRCGSFVESYSLFYGSDGYVNKFGRQN